MLIKKKIYTLAKYPYRLPLLAIECKMPILFFIYELPLSFELRTILKRYFGDLAFHVSLYQSEVDEAASAPNVRNSFYSIIILGAIYSEGVFTRGRP